MRLVKRIAAAGLSAAALLAAASAASAQGGGEALFKENCAACHQPDGKGVPGAFPALAGNSFVQGPAHWMRTKPRRGHGSGAAPPFRSVIGSAFSS